LLSNRRKRHLVSLRSAECQGVIDVHLVFSHDRNRNASSE
jgi:hypothetical protein